VKTNINFYTDDLKPKVYYLTLTNAAIVAGVLLLLMLLWFAQVSYKINHISENKKRNQTELASANEELQNYQQALVKHNNNDKFMEVKSQLEREVAAKSALLSLVTAHTAKESIDYSVVMQELTEHHDHNIWLTDFRFNKNNVDFHGYSLESRSVTRWMSYLQATKSFTGREFSLLNISAINDEVLEFRAATTSNVVTQEVGL